jgi:hypothetical protein
VVIPSGYVILLDLSNHDDGVEPCLSCGEMCRTSVEYIKSIRIAISLEWTIAGMRSQMIRFFYV